MKTPSSLDAINNTAFKKSFPHKEILEEFLNSVLHLSEGKKIEELHFILQDETSEFAQEKKKYF